MAGRWRWIRKCLLLLLLAAARPAESALLTLEPNVTVSERYSDNVFDTPTGRSADLITSLSPSLQLAYHPSNWSADAGYSVQPTWYLRHPDLYRINQGGNVHLSVEGALWTANAAGSLLSTTMSEEIAQANGGISIPRTRYLQEHAGTNVVYRPTRLVSTSFTYDYTSTRYNTGSLVDSDAHVGTLSETYSASPNDQWGLSGGFSYFHFGSGQSNKIGRGMLSWNHESGPLWTLKVATGLGFVADASSDWLVNATVARKYEAGTLAASYVRDIGTGGGLSTSAVVTQTVTLSATRQISRDLTGSLSTSYGDTSMPAHFWSASAGLSYAILRWLNGSVTYSHFDQRFNGTVRSNLISVSLSTHVQPWVLDK